MPSANALHPFVSPSTPPSSVIPTPHTATSQPNVASPKVSVSARLHGQTATRMSVPGTPLASTPTPVAYLVFLFGPGCATFRSVVEESAPQLDAESGGFVHWILLGDPRWSQDGFRASLAARGIDLAALNSEWQAQLDDRGAERNVVAIETLKLCTAFSIEPDELPLVLVFGPGAEEHPLQIQIPLIVVETPTGARDTLRALREQFEPGRIRLVMADTGQPTRDTGQELRNCVFAATRKLDSLLGSRGKTPITNHMKKVLVIAFVAEGSKTTEACKKAGISRQAMDKDPRFKLLLKRARAQARSGVAGDRRGSLDQGRVEVEAQGEEGPGDGFDASDLEE